MTPHLTQSIYPSARRRVFIEILLILAVIPVFSVVHAEGFSMDRESYADVLGVRNIPAGATDWKTWSFSDHGAWFGFALPSDNGGEGIGGFPGPFIMTRQIWLGDEFARLMLTPADLQTTVEMEGPLSRQSVYYPGLLRHIYRFCRYDVVVELIIPHNRIVLVRAIVVNTGAQTLRLAAAWRGRFFPGPNVSAEKGRVICRIPDSSAYWTAASLKRSAESALDPGGVYRIRLTNELKIPAGKSETLLFAASFQMAPGDAALIASHLNRYGQNPSGPFEVNKTRWNNYLRSVLSSQTRWSREESHRRIAVKALMTLVSNWRSAYGDLRHDGLFPSAAVSYFNGFWAWDSWKHAAALARFDPELAKNQVRAMFDWQSPEGMIPDVIYADQKENNWRDTKPPLAAWAVWKIYERTHDKAFLREIYPKLLKYHDWWRSHRDHDQNGLCEYGSTDGTLEAALWESGMDDAVRFDNRHMVQNGPNAWSIDVESVDLNAYLFAEKVWLARIAGCINKNPDVLRFKEEAYQLKRRVETGMFNPETGFFHDISLDKKRFLDAMGPEGWIPLWAYLPDSDQAAAVKKAMSDPAKFATFVPFPTVSRDNTRFNTGYWRGPVWLDQAAFAIRGLRNYGFQDEADAFTIQLFERPRGLCGANAPIRENYDPMTGEGLKANHFSWSAAALLLLYWNE